MLAILIIITRRVIKMIERRKRQRRGEPGVPVFFLVPIHLSVRIRSEYESIFEGQCSK